MVQNLSGVMAFFRCKNVIVATMILYCFSLNSETILMFCFH